MTAAAQVNPQIEKLIYKVGLSLATLLVAADLGLPTQIRDATDETLISAVGPDNVAAVRSAFPAREA